MKKASLVLIYLILAIPCQARIITVDDDGPADFNNIQAAIDDANDGDTVIVVEGTYAGPGNRDIDFLGKAITVRSTDPNDSAVVAATVIDCQYSGRGFEFHSGEGPSSVLAGLTITNGSRFQGGGIVCGYSSPKITNCVISNNVAYTSGNILGDGAGVLCFYSSATISNCIITGNQATGSGGGVYWGKGSPVISNCTISGNSSARGGGIYCLDCNMPVSNCILWGNTASKGPQIYLFELLVCPTITIFYSDIQGGQGQIYIDGCGTVNWGSGNIDVDPLFADAGGGDYHLQSQAGRWDPNSQSWVMDANTSVAIDAGDPASPIGYEPFPNGGVINMGVYGGTAEASKSYFGTTPCETIVAGDINGDCKVNFADFRLMSLHWLEDNTP